MVLDRSKLTGARETTVRRTNSDVAAELFLRVIDGLRLGHKLIHPLRLKRGTFEIVGKTRVKLLGADAVLWDLCAPLDPELRPYDIWVGGQDDGHPEDGYDLFVGWPDEAKQQELLGKRSESAHMGEICDAFTAGLTAIGKRVKQVLAAVQGTCEARSTDGWKWASVMELAPLRDFAYPVEHPKHGGPALQAEWLGPAAAQVFAALAADKPVLRSRDHKGGRCYHDIALTW